MKIERLRNGIEVYNKVDGKKYKVTTVNDQVGTAKELLEDGALGDATITITEGNSLIFRVERDPEPYPVADGYIVVNGILYKDGTKVCEQGQLYIEKILAALPGYLVLAVKSNTADNLYDTFIYEPARDRFSKCNAGSIPMPELVAYNSDHTQAVLAFSETKKDTVTDADGNEQEIYIGANAGIITVADRTVKYMTCDMPLAIKDIIVKELQNGMSMVYFVPTAPVTETGERQNPDHYTWLIIAKDHCIGQMLLPEKMTVEWSHVCHDFTFKSDGLLIVKTEEEVITINNPAVNELADYPILIDVTKEPHTRRLTFANPQTYKIKTLVSRSTKDRGYIVTIE